MSRQAGFETRLLLSGEFRFLRDLQSLIRSNQRRDTDAHERADTIKRVG
jgi:hypothetical protein